MPSLLDPHLKLDRAKVHLDALHEYVALFRESKSHNITVYEDLENRWFTVKFEFREDPPIQLALIAGDFVCCLRSCLDHLTWQLATITTANPSNEIGFPIHGVDSPETQRKIVKATRGVPDAAIAIMKQFQPYNSGDSYKSTHLWRLNKLWSVDKHRHILLGGAVTGWICKFTDIRAMMLAQVNQGGEMKFPIHLKDKVTLNPDCGVDVHFGRPEDGNLLTLRDFVEMYNFVANTVLPAFFGFFLDSKEFGK